jgi:hypothetical protein
VAKGKEKRHQLEVLQGATPMIDDRRVFCRFAMPDIPIRFKDLKIGDKGEGICKDIGGGGAGVECSHEIKARTPLEIWFDLPDGFEPMPLLGKAVWSNLSENNWRIGVAFERQKLMNVARILKMGAC